MCRMSRYYLQPTDHITGLGDATNTLTWGMNGTKVRIAQVRLGLWHSNKLASVDAPFVAAVKNAMPLDIAMGGSTNTVLHLLAAAQEAEIDFTMSFYCFFTHWIIAMRR